MTTKIASCSLNLPVLGYSGVQRYFGCGFRLPLHKPDYRHSVTSEFSVANMVDIGLINCKGNFANHVGNAELQKARIMMTNMFVNRRSRITSRITLNSRITHFWQVLQAHGKSLLSLKWTKRLREITSENVLMH